MLSFKCKNCGGEMSVDGSGELYCEYCGSKYSFQDKELLEYKNFRLQMLNFLRGVHDQKANGKADEDLIWGNADTAYYETADGNDVTIKYLYSHDDGTCTSYLTRGSALFVYPKEKREEGERALRYLGELQFPPADMKNLAECFPDFSGRYELKDGQLMLAFKRPEHLFPLSMFGSLAPEHVAWVISRMENICCVLLYSEIVHQGISEDSLWINPFTHHAVLMGHWWSAKDMEKREMPFWGWEDLSAIRKTAERVLGMHRDEAPKALLDFLKSRHAPDAYEDFAAWDKVIETGFGGRRFAKMDVEL
ncbi:MAG: TFIIB-type zinc ribbon-containing protein [Lachnospiraceae bacterium]|nr:TFIIB-type zinc ribbon-containing protein [Lachnospiraceae bacterium]